MQKFFIFFTVILFTVSCSSTKQYVEFTHGKELANNEGRIYLVKPSFAGSAVKVAIFCDDILIGNATNGSYLSWDIKEGMHTIGNTQFAHAGATLGSGVGEDILRVNVKAGKIYYVKVTPKFMGGFNFEILSKEDGEKIIKNRKKPTLNYIE